MNEIIKKLLETLGLLKKEVEKYQPPVIPLAPVIHTPVLKTKSDILYETAVKFLGQDVTPEDKTLDVVACAESVNAVFKKAFGVEIGGGSSTYLMWQALKDKTRFEPVALKDITKGLIIISPTGTNKYPEKMAHGHVAICGKHQIMGNNSNTGRWEANYTLETWTERYAYKGGYPIYLYKVL
jgi:hypothetical protein